MIAKDSRFMLINTPGLYEWFTLKLNTRWTANAKSIWNNNVSYDYGKTYNS